MKNCMGCAIYSEAYCPDHGDYNSYFVKYVLKEQVAAPIIGTFDTAKQRPKPDPLRAIVRKQIQEIAATAPADWHGGEELPAPPRDLTTYRDAFESARKNCTHPNYEDTVYAKREAYCPDCRQFIKRPRGLFG